MNHKTVSRLLNSPVIEVLCRWVLGGVFVYASWHKILYPGQFAAILEGYALFPVMLINPVAIVVPYLELVGGLALIAGAYPRGAAVLVNVMLLGFMAAITANLVRGHAFDCGCFSFSHDAGTSAVWLLVRDVLYFFLGLQVLFFKGQRRWAVADR